jgi:hypothetical protein
MVISKVLLTQLLIPVRLNKEEKPLGSVYISYMKGVSEKFKLIGNHYNIRTIFKTKHTLREFTHEYQAGKRSTTDVTMRL